MLLLEREQLLLTQLEGATSDEIPGASLKTQHGAHVLRPQHPAHPVFLRVSSEALQL